MKTKKKESLHPRIRFGSIIKVREIEDDYCWHGPATVTHKGWPGDKEIYVGFIGDGWKVTKINLNKYKYKIVRY